MTRHTSSSLEKQAMLGIDLGSSSTKGALVTVNGTVVATAERRHELVAHAPGRVDHDWRQWWSEFTSVSSELLADNDVDLQAVCVSGLGPCLLPADANGRPLRSVISYGVDTRASEQIAALYARYPRDQLEGRTGHPLTSQSVGPKMLWLRDHEPECWDETKVFFTSNSYIVHALTGAYIMDYTTASMYDPFFDSTCNAWNAEWIAELVPQLRFPALAWPHEVVGSVNVNASQLTGIPAGTPVACGTMDFWAENIGCGAESPGDCMLAYGTTMSISAVTAEPLSVSNLWTAPGSAASSNHVGGATSTAGALTDWMRQLTSTGSYETLLEEAARVPPGSQGLLVLPYFSGERTPIHDPEARGVVCGLTLSHGRAELYRAMLESTALSVRHVLMAMKAAGVGVDRVVAVGGGVRGGLWAQIVSDTIGLTQQLPEVTLGAPYGDALLAARAVGADRAGRWGRIAAEVTPEASHVHLYDELYALYRRLDDSTRDIAHDLGRTFALPAHSPSSRRLPVERETTTTTRQGAHQ